MTYDSKRPHKNVDGVNINLTADEITAQQAVASAWVAGASTRAQAAFATQAMTALQASDMVALRCMKSGVSYPAAWLSYVRTLRAIVAGTQSGPLPAQPAYPSGT